MLVISNRLGTNQTPLITNKQTSKEQRDDDDIGGHGPGEPTNLPIDSCWPRVG
uniref:Uncharacterized protein n=1 Tax=Arundo donax TaxID=35708 RepID=A0A0A9AY77_ARUDO